jgi:hypothetical protein
MASLTIEPPIGLGMLFQKNIVIHRTPKPVQFLYAPSLVDGGIIVVGFHGMTGMGLINGLLSLQLGCYMEIVFSPRCGFFEAPWL